jgi:enoyl-CoA hydratase/carnithine racemase
VGLPRALEMCLTARTVAAAEAHRLGLAEIVVPPGRLEATVADLAAALLATDAATARATKKLLQAAAVNTLDEQAAAERRAQADLQRERLGPLPQA